jgi:hypothetical protein
LDVKNANTSLHEKGGDPDSDGLIPPGTMLLFLGSLIHAGPNNLLCDWSRSFVFGESRRRSRQTGSSDVQMHPMLVAIYKFRKDVEKSDSSAKENFFKRLAECQCLYGKDNKPDIIKDLINWPITASQISTESIAILDEYEDFFKTNYEEYW